LLWTSKLLGLRSRCPLGEAPRYFGKSSREEILGAVKPLVALGNRVVCVQEVCGFGYCFHRELQAAGVESLVVAPEALNGRRKTDKRDAGKLCLLLVDYNPRFTLAHKPSEMACLLTLQRPLSVKRKISLIRVLLPGVVGDIVLTAALLAGGDDPIHKVMDTFGISREPHLQRLVAL
jgi:transposase